MVDLVVLAVFLCAALTSLTLASPVTSSYDTIVVGLGSAGATAASILARAGRRVLALEAQSRVGGRVSTRPFGDGIVEAGAEWIHGTVDSRVYDLAVENNFTILFQDDDPSKVHLSDGTVDDGKLFDLLGFCLTVMEEGSDINESFGDFIERRLREHLRQEDPEFLKDKPKMASLLDLMDLLVDSYEASNSWHDVTALRQQELLNGSQSASWHRHGYITFIEILLNIYKGGPGLPSLDIKLNKEVTRVQWSAGGVLVRCADGHHYCADNVIVTVSLGVLKERHSTLFSPPLPRDKTNAIDVLSIGVVDKIILQFAEPWPLQYDLFMFWLPENLERVPAEDRWTTRVLGTTSPAGANNTLTLWVNGENAKLVETLPEEVVRDKLVALLQRFVGPDVTVPQPTDMIRTTWYSNPFIRGSYSYDNVEVAKHPGLRAALAAPLVAGGAPRVLFAGEAAHTSRYGTVHGASDSGRREARRLLPPASKDQL